MLTSEGKNQGRDWGKARSKTEKRPLREKVYPEQSYNEVQNSLHSKQYKI